MDYLWKFTSPQCWDRSFFSRISFSCFNPVLDWLIHWLIDRRIIDWLIDWRNQHTDVHHVQDGEQESDHVRDQTLRAPRVPRGCRHRIPLQVLLVTSTFISTHRLLLISPLGWKETLIYDFALTCANFFYFLFFLLFSNFMLLNDLFDW